MSKFTIAPFSGAYLSPNPIPNQITVSNASQLTNAHFDQVLAQYLAGQPAPDLEKRLDEIFPKIFTNRLYVFQVHEDAAFVTETNDGDIRAPGTSFKRVEYKVGQQTGQTHNKGLTYRAEHDRLPRDGSGKIRPGWERNIATSLRKRLVRADYLRGIGALQTAAGAATGKVWSASTNPDGDLRGLAQTAFLAHKIKPNKLLIGEAAWQLRQDAYEAATRENHAMASHANYTEEQLGAYLGGTRVVREENLYATKAKGSASRILGAEVLYFHSEEGLTEDDPSQIKRFVSDVDEGGQWGVYVQRYPKFTDITVEHYSSFHVTFTSGIGRLSITAS